MSQSRSCTVFIGNIPYDALEDELRGVFSRVGAVESLRLVYDKDTKQPKGYGFCDYTDPDTAMSAVRNLNDVECNGRRLRIDLADNALRSRDGPLKASAPSLPLPLPAPDPPPRPALPPALSASPMLSLPGPRPVSMPAALPPDPMVDPSAATSPEAIIAAVSAHTEIAQTVAAMPQAQLQLCLGSMQRLAVEAPENARALLQDNPQLCYALLHAQLLLGMTIEPSLPPDSDETKALRAEAARRPVASHLMPASTGLILSPAVPGGLPGGLLRPGAPTMGLRPFVPGLLPTAPMPMVLPTGLPVAPQPGILRPPMAGLGVGMDMGFAPKGWSMRPPTPPMAVMPGLASRLP
mmetsp:Transcript_7597/g.20591  ORF Transcript_7597/g.20591 Transcript_7597/m.20591 type:complete len:351 (-) Transcript_7597:32-1084(-)